MRRRVEWDRVPLALLAVYLMAWSLALVAGLVWVVARLVGK